MVAIPQIPGIVLNTCRYGSILLVGSILLNMSCLAQEGTGGVDTTGTWACAEYMLIDFGQQSAPVVNAEGC